MTQRQVINASVSPKGSLETLSQREVQQLSEAGSGSTYTLFRQCALAILNTGAHVDNAKTILEAYKDFEIRIHQQDRGVRLELLNAPADAFVDGEMIASTREMLFSALRDIVYTENELDAQRIDLSTSQGISDYVFHLLRNARTLRPGVEPKIVVCWGGHSINTEEYKYTKKVGHELGLRSLDICTGCGPGVMKGPMKGATIAHAKQRIHGGRYLGLTEPGIIAAEAPNPIVNELVILPDIEKRLEAFEAFFDVRQDHQFVDDRVRRFGGDDARLGQAQVAAAMDALLGVGDGGAFHRAFHHARAATGADVEAAQSEFVADFLGVFVFFGVDRVAAPAHDDLRLDTGAQGAGVAQQVENVVADALRVTEVDALAVEFVFGVDDVAQGAEKHFPGAGDHFAIDEGVGRGIEQFQAYATVLLVNTDFEVLVGFEAGLGVINVGAGVENGQGALAKEGIGAAGTGFTQLLDFALGEGFKAAFWTDRGVDYLSLGHAMILKTMSLTRSRMNGIRRV